MFILASKKYAAGQSDEEMIRSMIGTIASDIYSIDNCNWLIDYGFILQKINEHSGSEYCIGWLALTR